MFTSLVHIIRSIIHSEPNNDPLQSILGEHAHLHINPSRLKIHNDKKLGSGGFGDVCLATLGGSSTVAVKALRCTSIAQAERETMAKRLAREIKVWAKAKHPNILELLGYYLSDDYACALLICPYMANGNITEYMKQTQVDVRARLNFVRGITSGMAFLHNHEPPICHGDLKPANVLVGDALDPALCDFGLATFIEDSLGSSGLTTSQTTKGSTRYMSPELLRTENAKHTLKSDVWAWACTIFEILTDCVPYPAAKGPGPLMFALMTGVSPGSPELLRSLVPKDNYPLSSALEPLHDLIPDCWKPEPSGRPSLSRILGFLPAIDLQETPTMPSEPGFSTGDHPIMGTIFQEIEISIDSIDSIVRPGYTISRLPSPLPGSFIIPSKAYFQGAYSDIYRGLWEMDGKPQEVCLRRLSTDRWRWGSRWNDSLEERRKRRALGEITIWRAVQHRNIYPFWGYTIMNDEYYLISPWAQNGSLETYLKRNPQTPAMMKLTMLQEATEGLAFLHGLKPPIVHGSLSPANILIKEDLVAALCDFGLSRVIGTLGLHTGLTTAGPPNTAAYQAPELFTYEESGETSSTDVYAMASVILTVMSGLVPFAHYRTAASIIIAIHSGETPKPCDHPNLPEKDPLWEFLRRCWSREPADRPTATETIAKLNEAIESRKTSEYGV